MTNITDWAQRQTHVTYDLAGHVKKITRPNGTYRSIDYDAAGEATNILEQMANGLPIAIFRLNWTNTGNMAWEFAAPLPHSVTVPTRTMTYDDDNRLATFNGTSIGNDSNGNLTSGPLTNNTFATYRYDARNRLLDVGGVTNVYDAMNNRIGQTFGTNNTVYVVNPNAKLPQVLMRIKNGVTNYYIYGVGLLYQITETATATNTLTYHYDYRGSTIALTADNGLVTDRIEYSAYGLTTYRTGTSDTPFLFNGRYGVQTDPNGLLYMRARYYNPYLCRFINPDPSGFKGGLNFYAYANGNPTGMLDPTGLGAVGDYTGLSWLTSSSAVPRDLSDPFGMNSYYAAALGYGPDTWSDKVIDKTSAALNWLNQQLYPPPEVEMQKPKWEQAVDRFGQFVVGVGMPAEGAAARATQLEFYFAKNFGQNSGLVIGRGADLSMPGALGAGEYKLGWFSVQGTSGMEAEWTVNQAKLQNVMNLNLPIRDASSLLDTGGFYLNRERGMLQSAGWNYQGGYWVPPAH